MVKFMAILFGIILIFAGVAGYLPNFKPDGLLLGYFEVDPIQNLIHIISGVLAIMAATSFRVAKYFFIIFGLVYTIAAILGFWRNGDLYGYMHFNTASNVMHLVLGVLALYLGFSARDRKETY